MLPFAPPEKKTSQLENIQCKVKERSFPAFEKVC